MLKGFVFGKFLPFHKGHEAMIRFALSKCDQLTVLVCCSDCESIPAQQRKKWLEHTFSKENNLKIKTYDYCEKDLPNTSASSRDVSFLWGQKFKKLFPDYQLLVTSEPYGAYVAEYMQIKHISFDPERIKVPVSASLIRSNLFNYWKYLPDAVKEDLAIKVVILGTESTGKSTLTKRLAKYYGCSYVSEAGRDVIPDSNSFSENDLFLVAEEHAKRIKQAAKGNNPLIIIDTDIHTTLSYGSYFYTKKLTVSEEIIKVNKADLYLYLKNDVPFVQDGTRLTEESRNLLDISHKKVLAENMVSFIEISGNWEERVKKAIEEVEFFLKENPNIISL